MLSVLFLTEISTCFSTGMTSCPGSCFSAIDNAVISCIDGEEPGEGDEPGEEGEELPGDEGEDGEDGISVVVVVVVVVKVVVVLVEVVVVVVVVGGPDLEIKLPTMMCWFGWRVIV